MKKIGRPDIYGIENNTDKLLSECRGRFYKNNGYSLLNKALSYNAYPMLNKQLPYSIYPQLSKPQSCNNYSLLSVYSTLNKSAGKNDYPLPVIIKPKVSEKKRKIRILRAVFAVVFTLLVIALPFFTTERWAAADSDAIRDAEDKLNESIEEQLGEMDFEGLEEILGGYDEGGLFSDGFLETVKNILNGNFGDDESFFSVLWTVTGSWLTSQIPLFLTVGAIAVLCGVVGDMKSGTLMKSTSGIVFYACYTLIILLMLTGIYNVYNMAADVIRDVGRFCDVIMPVLLTLMVAVGSGASAGVYQPAVALFGTLITRIIGEIILPTFMVSLVFTVVSNLSENVRLTKMSEFFRNLSVKALSIVFMIFSAFLTVKGVTAGIADGISFRAAKFATRNYIPIIGGYLSDGMDLFLAGSVLIKNSVGAAGLMMLFVMVFLPAVRIIVYGLLMKFTASVIEPIADKRISGFLSGAGKSISILYVSLFATGFMLFIMIMLMIMTTNSVIGI